MVENVETITVESCFFFTFFFCFHFHCELFNYKMRNILAGNDIICFHRVIKINLANYQLSLKAKKKGHGVRKNKPVCHSACPSITFVSNHFLKRLNNICRYRIDWIKQVIRLYANLTSYSDLALLLKLLLKLAINYNYHYKF